MARITENPKVVGLALLVACGVAAYMQGPVIYQQMMTPPPRPVVPPLPDLGGDSVRFYRLAPLQLPDRWQAALGGLPAGTMFDEPPKTAKEERKGMVLPDIPPGWVLSGVWISPEGKSAMVSGFMVQEGDILGDFQVAAIDRNQVLFRHPKGQRTLSLGQPLEASPPKVPPPGQSTVTNLPSNLLRGALEAINQWQQNTKAAQEYLEKEEGGKRP